MKFFIALALLCCVAYVSAQHRLGGLGSEKKADEEVRDIIKEIRSEFEKMSKREVKSLEPISYRRQVVAGLNYFVKVLAVEKDGSHSHHHLRIYKSIGGGLELSALRKDLDKSEPLDYFQ